MTMMRIAVTGGIAAGKSNRKKLESLIHPAIYDCAKTLEVEYISEYVNKISEENRSTEENHSALGSMSSIIVHDIPLLAQVIDSIPFSFDYIITVEAPKDVRIARMISERKMSQNQAKQRINNQVEEIERKKIADFVVDSTKPMEVMLKNVDSKIKKWMSKEH